MCRLSFIVPAFNEAEHIPAIIHNIRTYVPPTETFEIIVVDNGSTDGSYDVARRSSGVTALKSEGTVGAARNAAASCAQGQIFVFLDADVRLTGSWTREFHQVLASIERDPSVVTGSTVSIPDRPTAIEKVWFEPITKRRRSYINSGHLIVSRSMFERLQGFDARLVTGEDSDFSERAVASGGTVVNASELKAVHLGFPKTIGAFVRRELWHGQGDTRSVKALARSPVALTSILFTLLLAVGVITSVIVHRWMPLLSAALATVFIAAIFGVRRAKGFGARAICLNAALYYLYFFARAAAVFVHPKGWRQAR